MCKRDAGGEAGRLGGGGVAGVEAGLRGRQCARIIMYTYALLWNCSGYGA